MPVRLLFVVVSVATNFVRSDFFPALTTRPTAWLGGALAVGGVGLVARPASRASAGRRFVGSCCIVAGLLGALAAALFPTLLRSTLGAAHSLELTQALSGAYSRQVALYWWPLAFALAVAYLVIAFRTHRGPVTRGPIDGI